MATHSLSYTFTAATVISATEMNTNLSGLSTFMNTNMIQKDGSVAFLSNVAQSHPKDPTSANHLTNKAYVDEAFVAIKVPMLLAGQTGIPSFPVNSAVQTTYVEVQPTAGQIVGSNILTYTTSGNNRYVQIPTTGVYEIGFTMSCSSAVNDFRAIAVHKTSDSGANWYNLLGSGFTDTDTLGFNETISFLIMETLTAGDRLRVVARRGNAVSATTTNFNVYFQIRKIVKA